MDQSLPGAAPCRGTYYRDLLDPDPREVLTSPRDNRYRYLGSEAQPAHGSASNFKYPFDYFGWSTDTTQTTLLGAGIFAFDGCDV